jgi:oxygen-independent coproporphyrinogen-3 oxidase
MAGIYIHIPFCKQACTYCDFHFSTTFDKHRSALIEAILLELEQRKDYLSSEQIETIYFGGGTPSLLTENELKSILTKINSIYDVVDSAEITLEANPDDISKERLQEWKHRGVNRLSIGLQSFLQSDLDWMNRAHTAEESQNAVKLAKEFGFSLTVDLIYGLPERTLEGWKTNIDKLISLAPDHISAYCLTVENNTVLSNWVEKGKIDPASEDEQAEQFLLLVEVLDKVGYQQYEISNFAKEGQYSKHNSNYWKGVSYLGVGPSAHSFDAESRRWNVSNNMKYINGVTGKEEFSDSEILTPQDRFNEAVMTGLRTIWGVNLDDLRWHHCTSKSFDIRLEEFNNDGLLTIEKNQIILTKKGKLQADYIASELFLD